MGQKESWKYGLLACASVLLVLCCLFIYGVLSFDSLMSADVVKYDDPTRAQIDYFLELCDLDDLPIGAADVIVASSSPHKSDSIIFMVFDGDVTDWWSGFIRHSEGRSIRLPDNRTFSCDREKQISTFVWAYHVASHGGSKSLLSVSCVSGEEIGQLAKLGSAR